jgi:glycosyltransferase involved in cell wall biosynthesis
MAEKLSKRGHRVYLLLPGPRTKECDDTVSNPSRIVWPSARPTHLKDGLFLVRLIAKIRPTHLIANFASVNLMMIVGALLGIPRRISWYHTLTAQIDRDSKQSVRARRVLRLRKRVAYKAATDIVTNSNAGKRDLIEMFSVPGRKITVFPYGIADPVDELPDSAGPVEGDLVVCVGRLHATKGQDVLLHALKRLRDNETPARVHFIGGGPLRQEYEAMARSLGVSDRCKFLGGQPNADVLRRLGSAALSVVPSRFEAFGFVNIESMAMGTPVVASDVGGISEIIRDGVEGFLVPSEDSDALADRISRLLKDVSLRAEMSKNARARFLELYEQETVLTTQAKWIEGLVSTV